MTTVASKPDVLQWDDSRQRWSWAAMLVAILMSLAVGLGVGWSAFAPDEGAQPTQAQVADEPDEAIQQEGLTMINAYLAAWNAGNGRGVVSLMAENGVVGVVRPAEFRGFVGWTPLKSDVVRVAALAPGGAT